MLAKCLYIRLLCLVILECQLSSSQFPQHVDFQKMGEVVFNNEKYNILRPSVHLIKDYFRDYMLRRENDNFPTKRIFIDDNGFRHFWSGFESTFANSRKMDTYIGNGNDLNTDANGQKNRPRRKKPFDDSPEAMNILRNDVKKAAARAATTKKAAAATTKKAAAATTKKAAAATTKKAAAATTKKAAAATTAKKGDGTQPPAKKDGSGGGGKKLAITTFFCPFLGVLNMTSLIDG